MITFSAEWYDVLAWGLAIAAVVWAFRATMVKAAVEAEREACAKVCEQRAERIMRDNRMVSADVAMHECAQDIRARGKK